MIKINFENGQIAGELIVIDSEARMNNGKFDTDAACAAIWENRFDLINAADLSRIVDADDGEALQANDFCINFAENAVRVSETELVWSPEFSECVKRFNRDSAVKIRASEKQQIVTSYDEASGVLTIRAEFLDEIADDGFNFEIERKFAVRDCNVNIKTMDTSSLALRCQGLDCWDAEEFGEIVRRAGLDPCGNMADQLKSAGIPVDDDDDAGTLWECLISLAEKKLGVCVW